MIPPINIMPVWKVSVYITAASPPLKYEKNIHIESYNVRLVSVYQNSLEMVLSEPVWIDDVYRTSIKVYIKGKKTRNITWTFGPHRI